MERWLVDGMNVVGVRPDGWWRDRRAAMRALTADLDRFARASGDALTVVFDGRPFPLEATGVGVAFAPRGGPNAADDEIVRLVASDRDPRTIRVVTSDAALAERVREHGADVVPASVFRRRLDERAEH